MLHDTWVSKAAGDSDANRALFHKGSLGLDLIPGHFRGQAFKLGGVMSSPSGVGKYHM